MRDRIPAGERNVLLFFLGLLCGAAAGLVLIGAVIWNLDRVLLSLLL